MRNKYNYDELVKVNGIGKICGKVKGKLGFIIEKDYYYDEYYIDLIFDKKDWFKENDIQRVFEDKKNNVKKYQVRLCTTRQGYELIEKNLKENEPISNNKLGKISIYKEFKKGKKEYIAVGWKSVFWPVSNKSIQIIEETVKSFRKQDIPFQYIILNEDNLTDIKVYEFIENDKAVDIFFVERNIKMKKLKNRPLFEW
ncbi:MAG: hypothetical protein HFJ29_01020 [Clostridia bacterium]|nr:hypothetical protein [Clostridia bacterium]